MFYVLLARELHIAPGIIGLITSCAAVGGLAGALGATRFAARFGQGRPSGSRWLASAPFGFVAPFVQRDWTLGLLAVAEVGFGSASSCTTSPRSASARACARPSCWAG